MPSLFRVCIIAFFATVLLWAPDVQAENQNDIQVLVCYDCAYPEARASVEDKFQGAAACLSRQSDENGQGECDSIPDQFSVFSHQAEEMFSFRLTVNQSPANGSSGALDLVDVELPTAARAHYHAAWEFYKLLDSTQRRLIFELSDDNIDAPLTDHVYPPDSSFRTGHGLTQFQQYCAAQPGHMAVYMAFSDTFKEYVEARINEEYQEFLQSAEAREFLDRMTIEAFSPYQFMTLQDGQRTHIEFAFPRYLSFIRFDFGQPRNRNSIEHGHSSVSYTTTPSQNAETLELRTNLRLTQMGGWGSDAMAPASANALEPVMNDSCVITALNAHFAYIKQHGDGSLHSHNGFPDEETAQAQLYRREDGTLARTSNLEGHCRLTYFDEGFERRLTMHVPCD